MSKSDDWDKKKNRNKAYQKPFAYLSFIIYRTRTMPAENFIKGSADGITPPSDTTDVSLLEKTEAIQTEEQETQGKLGRLKNWVSHGVSRVKNGMTNARNTLLGTPEEIKAGIEELSRNMKLFPEDMKGVPVIVGEVAENRAVMATLGLVALPGALRIANNSHNAYAQDLAYHIPASADVQVAGGIPIVTEDKVGRYDFVENTIDQNESALQQRVEIPWTAVKNGVEMSGVFHFDTSNYEETGELPVFLELEDGKRYEITAVNEYSGKIIGNELSEVDARSADDFVNSDRTPESAAEFDMGNFVYEAEDILAAHGYGDIQIETPTVVGKKSGKAATNVSLETLRQENDTHYQDVYIDQDHGTGTNDAPAYQGEQWNNWRQGGSSLSVTDLIQKGAIGEEDHDRDVDWGEGIEGANLQANCTFEYTPSTNSVKGNFGLAEIFKVNRDSITVSHDGNDLRDDVEAAVLGYANAEMLAVTGSMNDTELIEDHTVRFYGNASYDLTISRATDYSFEVNCLYSRAEATLQETQTVRAPIPAGVEVVIIDGVVKYAYLFEGETYYMVADGTESATAVTSWMTEIENQANHAPDTLDDEANTNEDDASLIVDNAHGVLQNDSDQDGDPLTVKDFGIPMTTSAGGTITFEEGGGYTYTPPASVQSLAEGETLRDSVVYRAMDDSGLDKPATLRITIIGQNDAPEDSNIDLEAPFVGPGGSIVIANNTQNNTKIGTYNITDIDTNDTHTLSIPAGLNADAFEIRNDNELWLIDNTKLGVEQSEWTLRAVDSQNAAFDKQFSAETQDLTPPEMADSINEVNEDNTYYYTADDFRALDGELPAEIATTSLPAGVGEFKVNGNEIGLNELIEPADLGVGTVFTYRAPPNANGNNLASFTFRARDEAGNWTPVENPITKRMDVTPVNDAPTDIAGTTHSFEVDAIEGTAVISGLSTSDVDVGDSHTYAIVDNTGPTPVGSFAIVGDQVQIAAGATLEIGIHSLTIRSTDLAGGYCEKVFNFEITETAEELQADADAQAFIDSVPDAQDGQTEVPTYDPVLNEYSFFGESFTRDVDGTPRPISQVRTNLEGILRNLDGGGDWNGNMVPNSFDSNPFGFPETPEELQADADAQAFIDSIPPAQDDQTEVPTYDPVLNEYSFFGVSRSRDNNGEMRPFSEVRTFLEGLLRNEDSGGDWDNDGWPNGIDPNPFGFPE